LLTSVRKAAGGQTSEFETLSSKLRSQELPFFQQAGTCGHCGAKSGPSALSDRDYFDFEAYIQSKALLNTMCPASTTVGGYAGGSGENQMESEALLKQSKTPFSPREQCAQKIRNTMGDAILAHILDEVDVGDAAAAGIAPQRPNNNDALLSASPELDSIRRGCAALLRYFQKKGALYT